MRFILVILFLLLSSYSLNNNEFKKTFGNSFRIEKEKMEDVILLVDNISEYCNVNIACEMVSPDVLSVKLFIKNISERTISIPRVIFDIYNKADGVMTNDYITITNEKGEQPLYIGIYMKMMLYDFTNEDCIIMKSQQIVEIDMPNLFSSYDMENFEYKQIKVQYKGFFGISNSVVFDNPSYKN